MGFLGNNFFGRNRSFSEIQKQEMLERQGYQCAKCSKQINMRNSHADHIYPFSAGGDTSVGNGQMLCKSCHREKTANQQSLYYPNPKSYYGARQKNTKKFHYGSFDNMLGLDNDLAKKSKSSGFGSGLDDMLGFRSNSSGRRKRTSGFDSMFGFNSGLSGRRKKSTGFDDLFGLDT